MPAWQLNPMPVPRHPYTVVAHRGDHEHAPENTLAAFANAIKAGVDYIEIDLRTTADSQLVIMHDASVNRMTGGSGMIRDMTYDAIRALKVKDKTHPEWGEFDIPTFDQVLTLCQGKIYIYLDFKNADQYTDDMIKTANEKGYVVLPDIEGPNENPAFWDKALLKGFSGVQTDHPGELINYLKEKHLR